MSVTSISSAHIVGLNASKTLVELDLSSGLYSFSIVGLPDKIIDESKDRVVAALRNTGLKNPKTENHKITVSLSPANIPKEGSHFDLPITLAYLIASKQLNRVGNDSWFVGELSLSGEILPMQGILLVAKLAKKMGAKELYVPFANKEEAALITGLTIYGCKHLRDVIEHLGLPGQDMLPTLTKADETKIHYTRPSNLADFKDIKGQMHAKRALEIAACGGHNIALYGPPGTGKTLLAKAFTGILPPLTFEEVLEVTEIHSLATRNNALITHPPLRAPHHSASHVSLIGGGTNPKPGEITLAHHGVLFLDEFPEFEKRVIESLREPLEEGHITVSRAKGTYTFPASCILVASMNPCPCGYLGSKAKRCICKPSDIERYARKLSGPIMDRIDMWVPVLHVDYETLLSKEESEPSYSVAKRVEEARTFSQERFKASNSSLQKNKDISSKDIESILQIDQSGQVIMKKLAKEQNLSPRACHRVLRLARTIADHRKSLTVSEGDILEAFQYRPKLYQDVL
jgi:magnesium chelatase family protein